MTNDSDRPFEIESVIEHSSWVRGLAYNLVFNDHDIDDLVQDAWLAALKAPPRNSSATKGWLRSVIRNLASRRFKDKELRNRHEKGAARKEPVGSDPSDISERVELERRIVDLAMKLDEPYRQTLLLRFFDDLSPSEIGKKLGVPAGTIRARLKRALDGLRTQCDKEFGDRQSWCLAMLPIAILHPSIPAVPPVAQPIQSTLKGKAASLTAIGGASAGGLLMIKGSFIAAVIIGLSIFGYQFLGQTPEKTVQQISNTNSAMGNTDNLKKSREDSPKLILEPKLKSNPTADLVMSQADMPWVTGRIVDQDKIAVEGQVLALTQIKPSPDCKSDENGQFKLSTIFPTMPARIALPREDYPTQYIEVAGIEKGATLDIGEIVLNEARTIAGKVVDSKGIGIAGAKITLQFKYDNWNYSRGAQPFCGEELITGSNGEFEIQALQETAFTLNCNHPDYAPVTSKEIPAAKEDQLEQDFSLKQANYLRVQIVQANGEAASELNVSIRISTANFSTSLHLVTDKEGFMESNQIPQGKLSISFWDKHAPQGLILNYPSTDAVPNKIILPEASSLLANIQNTGIKQISYRLASDNGTARTFTDVELKNQVVSIPNIAAGNYTLKLWAAGFESMEALEFEVIEGETKELTVQLDSIEETSVVIMDLDGNPIPNAKVAILPKNNERTKYFVCENSKFSSPLLHSNCGLIIEAKGYEAFVAQDCAKLIENNLLEVQLGSESSLQIHINDGMGLPVEGAELSIRPHWDDHLNSWWNSRRFNPYDLKGRPKYIAKDGIIEVSGLRKGKYRLSISHQKEEVYRKEVNISGATKLTVDARTTEDFEISGSISINGQLVQGGHMHFYRPKPEYRVSTRIDANGKFNLSLKPGFYWTTYNNTTEAMYGLELHRTIEAGDNLNIDFKTHSLDLQIQDPNGNAVSEFSGMLYTRGLGRFQVEADENGRFRIDHMRAGKYRWFGPTTRKGLICTDVYCTVNSDKRLTITLKDAIHLKLEVQDLDPKIGKWLYSIDENGVANHVEIPWRRNDVNWPKSSTRGYLLIRNHPAIYFERDSLRDGDTLTLKANAGGSIQLSVLDSNGKAMPNQAFKITPISGELAEYLQNSSTGEKASRRVYLIPGTYKVSTSLEDGSELFEEVVVSLEQNSIIELTTP